MACFDVTFAPTTAGSKSAPAESGEARERAIERVVGADAYQQEGPLTTFFAIEGGRQVIDSWSRRIASFRTVEIAAIRRVDDSAQDHGTPAGALALVQTA